MKSLSAKNNVHIVFLMYWCVLVIWQNISSATNRSGLDLAIKVVLLGMLTIYFFQHSQMVMGRATVCFLLFVVCLAVPLFMRETFNLNILVSYLFPVLFVFLTVVLGGNFEINKKQLTTFLNVVIAVVVYMAVYAILFCTEQFTSAFALTSAYGNELTSFLVSSHEYGLYLVGGISGCIICLNFKQAESFRSKLPYIAALLLLIPNLILTFSRTSIFGMVCILLVYVVLNKKNKIKRYLIILGVIAVIVIACAPALRSFFYSVVFKENKSASRDILYAMAVDYYQDGSVTQKLWGHGIEASRNFFEQETTHGSVHNAYLQILVYFGICGLFFMVAFLLIQMYANFQLLKKNRFWGAMFAAILLMCIAVMMTNTAFIFNSSIDSYFLTIFAVVVPKYVRNSICAGTFDTVEGELPIGTIDIKKAAGGRAAHIGGFRSVLPRT